jgi:hypothetical protein
MQLLQSELKHFVVIAKQLCSIAKRVQSECAAIAKRFCCDCKVIMQQLQSDYAAIAKLVCSDCKAISK